MNRFGERLLVAVHEFLEEREVGCVSVSAAAFQILECGVGGRVRRRNKDGCVGKDLVVNRHQVRKCLLGAEHSYECARGKNGRHDCLFVRTQVGEFAPRASLWVAHAGQTDYAVCFLRCHLF